MTEATKEVTPAAPPPGVDQRTVSTASHKGAASSEAAVGDNGDVEVDEETLEVKAKAQPVEASLPKEKSAAGKRKAARRELAKKASNDIGLPAYDGGRREHKTLPEPKRVDGGTRYGNTTVAAGFGNAGGASGINPQSARSAAGALSGRPYIKSPDVELPPGS